MSTTFPEHRDIQAEFRIGAGVQRVLMPAGVTPGTQGAAIDFWLRMLVDPQPSIALPLIGLLSGRAQCAAAGKELLRELAAGQSPRRLPDGEVELLWPAAFADRGDAWWARVCYALALLVELYRATAVEYSRLMGLHEHSHAADLLALATDAEVADLIAMRDLALDRLLRADGTRAASLGRTDLDQLLGYALMDYSNTYSLHAVGVYAVRFGYLGTWTIAELGQRMAGRSVDLADLRAQFAQVLRTQLPPYQSRRGW